MIYIFDIDGTLANIDHRLHHITRESKDWNSFYEDCVDDEPIREVIEILECLVACGGYRIWIFTGRSDLVKNQTEEWLMDNTNLSLFKLKMRPHGDHSPDYKLKKKWLDQLAPKGSEARKNIGGVFEDRKSVCDMWRNEGLRCFQVDKGEF